MSRWDDLAFRDKAALIKDAVRDGIYDLNTVRDYYNNSFNDGDIVHIPYRDTSNDTISILSDNRGEQYFIDKIKAANRYALGGPEWTWTQVKGNSSGKPLYVRTDAQGHSIDSNHMGGFRVYTDKDVNSHSYISSLETDNSPKQENYVAPLLPITGYMPDSEIVITPDNKPNYSIKYGGIQRPEDGKVAAVARDRAVDKQVEQTALTPLGMVDYTLMPLNVLSPTHTARSLYEIAENSGVGNLVSSNIQANPDYGAYGLFTDIFGHNNGIVSDEFATEHPLLSTIINLTGDVVSPVAGTFAAHPSTAINAVKGGINDMSNIMKAGYNSVNSALDRGADAIYNRLRAFNRDFIHTKATQNRLLSLKPHSRGFGYYSKALDKKITDLDDARNTLWNKRHTLQMLQDIRPLNLNTLPTKIRGRSRSVPDFSKMSRDDVDAFLHLKTPNADKMLAGFDSSTGTFTFPKDSIARLNPNMAVKTGNITIIDAATGKPTTFYLDPINDTAALPSATYRQMHLYNGKAIPFFESETTSNKVAQAIHPEAPTEYLEAVGKNIDYVTQQAIPGSKVFGSSANVRAGNLYHDASDIDVITTRARAKKHPEYKNWQGKRSDTNGNTITYKYDHPTAGDLDINVIDETKDGFAVGDLAHELYAQLYPDRYRELMMEAARKTATGEGAPVTTNIPLDVSAEELLSKYDPVNKSIVDAFASSKDKHMGRALYLLNYGKTEDVQKGFNSYMNYLLGGKYKPSSVGREAFSDPATNAKLIESWGVKGINPENFVNDPDRMKMLFDYKIYEDTFLGRGVLDTYGGENVDIIKSLTYWYPETQGGTANGVGLNTVLGGDSGHGSVYATLRPKEFETLQQNSIAGVEKAIQQVHAETQLTPEQVDFVNKLANKLKLPIKTFSPDNTWWRDVLRETQMATGKNYKEFINTINQEYNIPIIRSYGYDNRYASVMRDLAEDEITQIFPRGLDRPVGASQRGNSSAVIKRVDDLGEELSDITRSVSNSTHILPSKHAEYNPVKFNRLSKKYSDLLEDRKKLVKEDTDMYDRHLEKLTKKYQQLEKINEAKSIAKLAGISLSGVTALVGGTKAAYDSNRRLKRLQAEDALSTLARISAFEPSIPITRKVKHK